MTTRVTSTILPEPIEGVDIGCEQICLIKPCRKENLYPNPRFSADTELDFFTVGVAEDFTPITFGNTNEIMQVSSHAYVGGRSLQVSMTQNLSPSTSSRRGVLQNNIGIAFTKGTLYTFSAWVRTPYNHRVKMAAFGSILAPNFIGEVDTVAEKWTRISGSLVAPATTIVIGILFSAEPDLPLPEDTIAYIDGIQIEEGGLTTYLDGEMQGFTDDDYQWRGPAHNSTSVRSAYAHDGGTEKSLCGYGANLLALGGFNKGATSISGNDLALVGGQSIGGVFHGARTVTMSLAWCGRKEQIRKSKAEFIGDLNPNRSLFPRPTRLIYKQTDHNCKPICEDVTLDVFFEAGFDAPITDEFNERYDVILRAPRPNFTRVSGIARPLSTQSTVSGNIISYDDQNGWRAIDQGLELEEPILGSYEIVDCNGNLFAYGEYSGAGPGYHPVWQWNGKSWRPVGSLNGDITAMGCGANGHLYAFATNGRFFEWQGQTWIQRPGLFELGGNVAASVVRKVIVHPNGLVYFLGMFDEVNNQPAESVAIWNGTGWVLPSGVLTGGAGGSTGLIADAYLSDDGTIYIVGLFDYLTEVGISANGVARITDPNTGGGYTNLVGGPSTGGGGSVIECGGLIYVGESNENLQVFDGTVWSEVNIGTDVSPIPIDSTVSLACDCESDAIHIGTIFTAPSEDTLITITPNEDDDNYTRIESPIEVVGLNFQVNQWLCTEDGRTYFTMFSVFAGQVGFLTAPTHAPICNPGTAKFSDVTIEITGPMTLESVGNITTGQKITFNNLVLGAEEILTIRSVQGAVTIHSNARGNLSGTLGIFDIASCRNLGMIPCLNFYSLEASESPLANTRFGDSRARIYWNPQYNTAFDGCNNNCEEACCNGGVSPAENCKLPDDLVLTPSTAEAGESTEFVLTGENLEFTYSINVFNDNEEFIIQNIGSNDEGTEIAFRLGIPNHSIGNYKLRVNTACGSVEQQLLTVLQSNCSAQVVTNVTPASMPANSTQNFTATINHGQWVHTVQVQNGGGHTLNAEILEYNFNGGSEFDVVYSVTSDGITGSFDVTFISGCDSTTELNALTVN